ncbi:MAG: TIGR03905 family TSCPD domain-containing protein [Clostridia bacterium]|nr:TIGR03905 family TSCPD domain-containing protein [Clostridia bacterium]
MTYTYRPGGVCSAQISFDMENDVVTNVKFLGGCAGNTQGIAKLCEGRDANDIIEALEGIQCGYKGTSCPDQLAKALKEALES